ncbi:MAG: ABC transporter ATP-binding protein [Nitrospiraceae bacterium]
MADDIAISAQGLSKRYRIRVSKGREGHGAATVSPGWVGRVQAALARASRPAEYEDVWSLRDATFEIKRGEIVGLIGRNGAGKSTLLKILSRITEPTGGRAEMYGRVGTLLEVGTGFHPELTGRDNIYLSGVILGMSKDQIRAKFDEIVAFSDIGKYIDTPVKRYSSGMYVRLAFAVGAYLDPEVLIVDEVLAVGDSSFQKKCLARMQDIGDHGRTVVFVSHNMQAITRLCKRAILLDKGKVIADGAVHDVVGTHMHAGSSARGGREWTDVATAPGDDVAKLMGVRVRTRDGAVADIVDIREPISIELEIEVLKPGWVLTPDIALFGENGECIFEAFDMDPEWRKRPRPVGRYIATAWIPGNLLSEGAHFVGAYCISIDPSRQIIRVDEAIGFRVVDSCDGDSARGDFMGDVWGVVRPMLKWSTKYIPHAVGDALVPGREGKRT